MLCQERYGAVNIIDDIPYLERNKLLEQLRDFRQVARYVNLFKNNYTTYLENTIKMKYDS